MLTTTNADLTIPIEIVEGADFLKGKQYSCTKIADVKMILIRLKRDINSARCYFLSYLCKRFCIRDDDWNKCNLKCLSYK